MSISEVFCWGNHINEMNRGPDEFKTMTCPLYSVDICQIVKFTFPVIVARKAPASVFQTPGVFSFSLRSTATKPSPFEEAKRHNQPRRRIRVIEINRRAKWRFL